LIDTISRLIQFVEMHAVVLMTASIAMLIVTLVAFPFVLARLPPEYFAEENRQRPPSRRPAVHWLLMGSKNLLGIALVLAGVLLMFLPGQGLLTLIIGLTIMNYPGKFTIERWLVRRPRILPALNWLRRRIGVQPFVDP
jgi:hypothetical protein